MDIRGIMGTMMGMEGVGAAGKKGGLGAKDSHPEGARLKRAVSDFEALFINYMLKTMRSTVPKSGLLGSGMREDVYTSLFDWEISREMAKGGGVGLGKMLLEHLGGGGQRPGPGAMGGVGPRVPGGGIRGREAGEAVSAMVQASGVSSGFHEGLKKTKVFRGHNR